MTPRAPLFRSLDQLTGDLADSPVEGILATATHIHDAVTSADQLRNERDEALTRVQELTEALQETAEMHMRLVNENARLRAVVSARQLADMEA